MVVLKSDNRTLVANAQYSYLADNISSSVGSITIVNTDGFSADGTLLIEDIGKETAEIFRIGTVNATTGVITLLTAAGASTSTRFAHAESTKVYALPYDQIRFYRTALVGDITDETPTFATTSPLTSWAAITPASWYSTYSDTTNTTGFGWFVYRDSVTENGSQESNPIPYAGFDGNTVAEVFADFESLLNTNELKLVTTQEKFAWINEALTFLRNKLNLNNSEYFVSTLQTITITSASEYILPDDFTDLVYIVDADELPIPYIDISKIGEYTGDVTFYYLRGRYIGFVPTPDSGTLLYYRYRSGVTRVTSLSTYITLPDGAYYALKDFMLFRAHSKFQNPIASQYYESFTNSVNHFIQSAVKRSAHLDSWEPASWANV